MIRTWTTPKPPLQPKPNKPTDKPTVPFGLRALERLWSHPQSLLREKFIWCAPSTPDDAYELLLDSISGVDLRGRMRPEWKERLTTWIWSKCNDKPRGTDQAT